MLRFDVDARLAEPVFGPTHANVFAAALVQRRGQLAQQLRGKPPRAGAGEIGVMWPDDLRAKQRRRAGELRRVCGAISTL